MKGASILLLVLAALTPVGAGRAEEPVRDVLAGIDAALAAENAQIRDGRPDWKWIDGDRLLFRSDSTTLDIALVSASGSVPAIPITTEAWLRPALRAADATGEVVLDGMSRDGGQIFLVADGKAFAVDPARRTAAPDPARTRAIDTDRPQLISDQFPTTFGPLREAASPDGRSFVGVRNDNIYVRRAGASDVHMLTDDGTPERSWLGTEESAQGLNALWSPGGDRIAAVRLDSGGVAHEPLMHWLARAPQVQHVVYPRAGDPIHRFDLAVIDARNGTRTAVRTGDTRDHYVNLLGWLADGRTLLYQVVDREQKTLTIFAADAASGVTRPILRETRATYIDTPMTLSPVLVHPPADGGFLYLSERDGWRHIYRYDGNGRLLRRLTRGAWPVEDIVRVDRDHVYFRAARAPYTAGLFRVPLDGGTPRPVAAEGNVNAAFIYCRESKTLDILKTAGVKTPVLEFAPDGRHVLTVRSGPTTPPVADVRAADGSDVVRLSTAQLNPSLPHLEDVRTRSTDGRFEMHGIIVRPANFDPARRYPVVEIIYAGMQLDFLPRDAYGTGWWRSGYNALMGRILAQRGYVVVYASAPGTPGRGRAFQDATYGIWPQTVIPNHAKFLREAAATRPWMDLSRVGVFGNSWGGYMAQRALIEAPELYRAAVALSAPSDFIDHPTYIEPFMGLPMHNRAGYAAASNLDKLANIRGSVLVMPEPLDVNAGFSPAMRFVDRMIEVGGDVELFTLPEVNHRVNCCGWTRERYAYAMAARYLDRKLGTR